MEEEFIRNQERLKPQEERNEEERLVNDFLITGVSHIQNGYSAVLLLITHVRFKILYLHLVI